jgi:O-antigen/teichoic acid export membrane protein
MAGTHRNTNLVPSVAQTTGTNIASVAVGAVAGIIVARTLGPHDRGVYGIVTVTPAFIGIVGTLGIEEAVVYLVGRGGDRRSTGELIWGSLALALVLGAAAGVISVVFQFIVFWRASLGVSTSLFIAAAFQPLQYVVFQVSLAHLRAQARYTTWNVLRVLVPILYLAGLVVFAYFGRVTVNDAVLCLITANVTVSLATLFIICFKHRPFTSRVHVENMLSNGWKNHLITVQTYANQQLDQVFIAVMAPAAQLGLYAIAVTYANAGLSLGLAPALQMYSHFSRQDRPDRAAYRRLVWRTLILLIGSCGIAALIAPIFIPLVFGRSYDGAVKPALILVLSSPLLSLSAMFAAIWKSAGKPLVAAKAQGAGLLLTLLSLPVAIHYFGIVGAAVVSIIVYAVVASWLAFTKPFDGLLTARGLGEDLRTSADDSSLRPQLAVVGRNLKRIAGVHQGKRS